MACIYRLEKGPVVLKIACCLQGQWMLLPLAARLALRFFHAICLARAESRALFTSVESQSLLRPWPAIQEEATSGVET